MNDNPDANPGSTDLDTALADVEAEYQTYRVLKDGEEVSARIDAIGFDGMETYVRFDVSEERSFTISLAPNVFDLSSLADLCADLDVPFTGDLGPLVGETVTLRVEDDQLQRVSVEEGGLTDRAVVDPVGTPWSTDPVLPDDVTTAIERLRQYDRLEETVHPVTVRSVGVEGNSLLLRLDLLGQQARWTVAIPDHDDIPGSTFERLVEDVGFGTVRQIEEGRLYTVPATGSGVPADEVPDAIGTVEDLDLTWLLFPGEDPAVDALEYADAVSPGWPGDSPSLPGGSGDRTAPRGEYVTPERVAKLDDVLGDDETVHYLGMGGGIEIERGESTDVVTSLSGMERIALTDRRIVMKSSQVSGDEVYSFEYVDVVGVELKTGFLNKKLSIHTDDGTYHFKGSNPDDDEYREMVTFVEERID